MKRLLMIIFVGVLSLFIITDVYAVEKSEAELTSINETSSFSTDSFDYSGVSYVPILDSESNYGIFNIDSVTNKSKKTLPISIDILLFDKDKKNIGFLTYCTERDYGSGYAQYKLKSNMSSPISINAVKKYFVEDVKASDVSYYSIYDDNIYCHIGGYTKYKGLTLEEIKNGDISIGDKKEKFDYMSLFSKINFGYIIGILVSLLIGYIIVGVILNALNKSMNAESSILAYLPIGNSYMAVKLAFGNIIAKWYILIYVLSIVLYIISIKFIMIMLSFVSSVAFIIDIVKLITKKYDLLVFNPATNGKITDSSDEISDSTSDNNSTTKSFILSEDQINSNDGDDSNESEVNISSGAAKDDEMIDLNYSAPMKEGTLPINVTANKPVDEEKKDDGESDLRNFFS